MRRFVGFEILVSFPAPTVLRVDHRANIDVSFGTSPPIKLYNKQLLSLRTYRFTGEVNCSGRAHALGHRFRKPYAISCG